MSVNNKTEDENEKNLRTSLTLFMCYGLWMTL